MADRGARSGHGVNDVRRSEGGEAFLSGRVPVWASKVEDAFLKHDEHRTEGL